MPSKRPVTKSAAAAPKRAAKVRPADVLKAYPGGVSPHKAYPVRMDDEIVDHARLLYFVVTENLDGAYSYDAIATVLKRTYPAKCSRISRMTVYQWVVRLKWREQRQAAVDEAYKEASGIRERQEVYKKIVTGKHGIELAELSALIHKPASGMTARDIQKNLRENERALLEATQNRLGLVLVELRCLNGIAYQELSRRASGGDLLYAPKTRRDLLDEYRVTSDLLVKLYGIHLLQKMAGIEPAPPTSPKGDGVGDGTSFSDDMLRQCNIELPSDLATLALKMFSARTGGNNAQPISDGGESGKNPADSGSAAEPTDPAETVEVEPAED